MVGGAGVPGYSNHRPVMDSEAFVGSDKRDNALQFAILTTALGIHFHYAQRLT